jgi:hypothetical protein
MPIKIKKKKEKKQKQKQKQIVNQRVVVNLADTKPRRRVARRRPQVSNIPQSDASLRQIVTQYVPIQSGSSVPSIVKYYNNIMTPKTEPIKDITEGLKAVRQQQQEDYTNAISQSAKQEDMRETKQAEAGIINPLVAEQDDMDVMNRAIIQQAEDYNKPKKKKKLIEKLKLIPLKRGRKAGSKNRSREEIEAERRAKLEKSREKRNRIAAEVLLEAQQRNQRIQEEGGEDFTDALKKIQDGDY